MTDISFNCPVCGHQFNAQLNQDNICPSCKTPMKVLDDGNKQTKPKTGELTYRLPEKEPYEGRATQKQKQKLWDIGFKDQNIIDNLGKRQASALIDQVLAFYAQERDKRKFKNFLIFLVWAAIVAAVVWLAIRFSS